MGSQCNIGEHAFIESGATIGNHVTVKNGVSVWTGVHVEDNAFLGPHCVFTNDMNPRVLYQEGPGSAADSHSQRCHHWCRSGHCLRA